MDGKAKYAAKVLKIKDKEKEQKKENKLFDNEVNILKYLKNNININYITNLIDSGIGEIKIENRPNSINKYLILEYAEKGSLFNYIYFPEGKLEERFCKRIFYKILRGIQSLHEANICHRDIKLQNILLDNEYNPKLCDFGLASLNSNELKEFLGTRDHAAPEILCKEPYNGFKIDIFSLGVTLFRLVTSNSGFGQAINDKIYNYIRNNCFDGYWFIIKAKGIKELSDEFKKLYIKMVSFEPENRPNIQEILNSEWMEEIMKLNEEEITELDNDIKEEFEYREMVIEEKLRPNMEIKEKESSFLGSMRSGGEDMKEYFDNNIIPKCIETEKGIDNFIKIKGNINPADFMNVLINKLYDKFENNIFIEESKNSLKFNIIFEEEEEEENKKNEEIKKYEEEMAKLNIKINNKESEDKEENENNEEKEDDSENEIMKKDNCIIQVKLFKLKNEEHLLRFVKKSGELEVYYNNLEKIIKLIKNLFESF